MYKYKARLIRCVDGDTADFMVDLGFKVYVEIRTRFLGFDTPERGHSEYSYARKQLEIFLAEEEDADGNIMIQTHKTGKYGRWLVYVENVNNAMAAIWPQK